MSAEDELCRQLTVYFFANIVSKLGNNISIKEDVMKRRRVYVTMNVQVSPDGIVRPRSMIWEDGEEYEVDRVKRIVPTDEGTRYTLMIDGKENTFIHHRRET